MSGIYDRGLDKDVLLVACGEFGRTPWINQYGGRNHWATSGSVLFAGGGLRTGQVIGDTGPIGEREQVRSQALHRAKRAGDDLSPLWRIDPARLLDRQPSRFEELI